ncbi:MAG: hypothetical protein KDC45_07070 [Bacteroidetes bacterium]|nr:hypothetical protein [Bacteroidota bacterium]
MNISFEEPEGVETNPDASAFGWSLHESEDALEELLLERFRGMTPEQKQMYLDYAEILLKMSTVQLTRKQKVDILKAIEESARKPTTEELTELVREVVKRKKY